nr:MAG TPA: Tenascin EGF domain [Caudoviricetes sp.]DAH69690.1 MAG TPA: Tenascin EGF domain [Caudoviricetes sp.]DAU22446.1 MAG TPA: Tenascin EGF domain [Caudoviricetes sp.]DAU26719.1 MAG TPA: Tenascin EGF domain [Caudoviricetes sp.]DAU36849.1 MAG TPA: Tenascin EGF domain [Caudoviricetes sp.]
MISPAISQSGSSGCICRSGISGKPCPRAA